MSNERLCLIIGLTVRSLAASARKGGIGVYAVDVFADTDTVENSINSNVAGFDGIGLDIDTVCDAVEHLDPQKNLAVIYGGGLEHNPALLNYLSQNRPLIGNSAQTIACVTKQAQFASALDELGIPYPETRFDLPTDNGIWLQKTSGGSGGMQTNYHSSSGSVDGAYFQRFQPGRIITATVYAHKQGAQIVGFSEQWCSDSMKARPFAYGGAVSIDHRELTSAMRDSMQQSVQVIASHFELRGLMSVDMIVNGNDWYLLEVNPRPSATFELHESSDDSFVLAHWEAFEGKSPRLHSKSHNGVFEAHWIVYASSTVRIPSDWTWQPWVSDLPAPGEIFQPEDPVCTVYAEADSSAQAKQMILERYGTIATIMKNWTVD